MSEYIPTTDEVETAYHEYTRMLADAGDSSVPAEFSDWTEGRDAFGRWWQQDRESLRREIARQIWNAIQEVHDMHRAVGKFTYGDDALGQITGLTRALDIATGDNRDFE